jgi:hypothetical protein
MTSILHLIASADPQGGGVIAAFVAPMTETSNYKIH